MTQPRFLKLFGALVISFSSGCMDGDFKKYVELGELRILGIVASQPEVSPGDSVTLTPWISDINNAGTLNFSWVACVDPGVSRGAEPSCLGNPTATPPQTGTVSTLNAGNTFSDAADSLSVTIPATVLLGRSTIDQWNGIAYLVVYTVSSSAGAQVTAVKRLIVSDPAKTTKNQNPVVTDVLADGAPFTSLSVGRKYTLSSTLSAAEAYQVRRQDGVAVDRVETLQSTWFYTDGETQFYRTLNTDANTYETPSAFPATRNSFLILSVRDGRGGQALLKKNLSP